MAGRKLRHRGQAGTTLVELVVSVVIIGLALTLLVGAVLAGAVGAGAWFISGKSNSSFMVTTLIMLIVEFLAMIPLLVVAFGRFDPSVDTPA